MNKSVLAVAIGIILGFGILSCWVTVRWAIAVFQTAFFALAATFLIVTLVRRGSIQGHWIIGVTAAVAVIGCVQIVSGITVSANETLTAAATWLCHTSAIFLTLQFATSTRLRRPFLESILWFGTIIATFGIIQNFTSSGKVFWIFDSGYQDLVLGPFVYHNKYAQFIELLLPAALVRAAERPNRLASSLFMVAAMLAGSIAGASRSGVAIALIETVVVLMVIKAKGMVDSQRMLRIGSQAGILIVICGGIVGWELLGERLQIDPLTDLRIPIMKSSVDMIQARPLTGFGLGAWDKAYPEFARFDNGLYTNQAHCDWLQWPAEGGIFLLVLMLGIGALAINVGREFPWSLGVTFVLIHGLLDYPMQQVPQFATLVFVVLALGVGARIGRQQNARIQRTS